MNVINRTRGAEQFFTLIVNDKERSLLEALLKAAIDNSFRFRGTRVEDLEELHKAISQPRS